ncbi:iron ABC transporter permease, partial [bacterium]|nr:iron ABC transporter permease [bacterium]
MSNLISKKTYLSTWVIILAICVAPLLTMAFRLIPQPELFSTLYDSAVLKSLFVTLGVGSMSLVLALVLGLPLSFIISRTRIRGRRFFEFWLLFPFFIPSYLFAIAWVVLALPQVGILNRLPGLGWINIYSFWGLVWVTCNAYFPVIVNTLSKSFSDMDSSLEEAARICGASPAKVFFSITLPCQFSTIIGAALVFLFITLSSFGIPAIIGNPAKLYVLTTQVFTYSKMGGLKGTDQAFVISLWLIAFALSLTFLGRKLKDKHSVPLMTGKATRPSLVDLGKWEIPSQLYLCGLLFFFILLPLGSLILSSFFSVAGSLQLSNLSFRNYEYLFQLQEARTAILNSLTLSFLGGITCCGLGLAIVFFSHRSS